MREGCCSGTAFPHASRPPYDGRTTGGVIPAQREAGAAQPGGAVAPPPWPVSGGGTVSGGACGSASYCVGSKPLSSSASGAVGAVVDSGVVVPVSPPVSEPPDLEYLP